MRGPKQSIGTTTLALAMALIAGCILSGCAARADAARRLAPPVAMTTRTFAGGLEEGGELGVEETHATPAVTIYGMAWCGPCHQAAAFLAKRGIPFVEKDLAADPDAQIEMQDKLRSAGLSAGAIPVLDVKGRILVGFSPEALRAALAPSAAPLL